MTSVGRPLPHDSAIGHVTGRAWYVEDYPPLANELWVEFAGAPVATGRIVAIDIEAASAVEGVVGVYTFEDIPGKNQFGPIFHDEPFLVEAEVHYFNQPVVVIAATSRQAARRAKQLVKIKVEEAIPILSIEDAIQAGSYLGPIRRIARGDVESGFARSSQILDGVFRCNGQEQFYLEAQACQAIPGEGGQLKLLSSTQNPTETQAVVAEVFGLGMHQVVCECKRMGGGFGGKETQSAIPALMVGLVAQRTGRPARTVYRRDTDMLVTGKRHAYISHYRVGFDDLGQITAIEFQFFSNGGAFADLSTSVMERTMLHADNAYYFPNVSITGQVCRTNLPPNTAFRGFGGPQSVIVIENILQEIAQTLQMDAIDVRKINLYRDGDLERNRTPYGQIVEDHVLPEHFTNLAQSSGYFDRRESVRRFNARSETHVKGLAMTGIKFGISFTSKFLNQGNALVNVYTDGTIQVSTGGTEMGQGLNTKIRQLVADVFGVECTAVVVMTTSTEKNNNTSPTAASAGTDLNGAAAVLACEAIRDRIARFVAGLLTDRAQAESDVSVSITERAGQGGLVERRVASTQASELTFAEGKVTDTKHPTRSLSFAQACDLARRERVDLGQRSFYSTPGVDFDRELGQGTPFHYFTTGAAVAEVTLDRFTGEVVVDAIDLTMDIGQSINPGIDRGQIIGGFVQGMGWCTTEELVYDERGKLLATGPTTYKIPGITDIPKRFEVAFADNPKHQKNVRLSKAVGEPPLMLGLSVWCAIKDAMASLRPDVVANLKVPATNEEVLMCLTSLSTDASTRCVQAAP